MKRARISLSSLAIAGLIGAGLSAAPIGFDDQFAPEFKSAFAKGKGSGKSGGKGGKSGKGGGHGHSGSNHGADLEKSSDDKIEDGDGNGKGLGHVKASGNGHANNHDGDGDPGDHGKLTSALGNLNAAHASPTGLANASDNSMVGLLRLYAIAVNDGTLETEEEQRQALGEISNKSYDDAELGPVVDAEVVDEVNALLDGKVPAEDADAGDDEEEEAL